MEVKKVKFPVKAALARFLPIRNHLHHMELYLIQGACGLDLDGRSFGDMFSVIHQRLKRLEQSMRPLQEKQNVGAGFTRPGRLEAAPTEKQGNKQ